MTNTKEPYDRIRIQFRDGSALELGEKSLGGNSSQLTLVGHMNAIWEAKKHDNDYRTPYCNIETKDIIYILFLEA